MREKSVEGPEVRELSVGPIPAPSYLHFLPPPLGRARKAERLLWISECLSTNDLRHPGVQAFHFSDEAPKVS